MTQLRANQKVLEKGDEAGVRSVGETLSLSLTPVRTPGLEYVSPAHRYPATVYGLCQSLYESLKPETITRLEEALFLRNLPSFPSAIAMFDAFAAPEKHIPVISFEHSVTLLNQGCAGLATGVLRDALSYASQHEDEVTLQVEPQYRLLRVMLGVTECISEGTFTKGIDAMHDMKEWLTGVPVEKYTDIQVICISWYYHLVTMAKLFLKFFDESKYDNLPYVDAPSAPWAGIARLREHLQREGRMGEARVVLQREMSYIPTSKQKLEVVQSFIDDCTACQRPRQPLSMLEVGARFLLSTKLWEVGDPDHQAEEELLLADGIFQSVVPDDAGDLWHHTRLQFDFSRAKMDMTVDEAVMYAQWVSLADKAKASKNFDLLVQAIGKSEEIAAKLALRHRSAFWKQEYFAQHARLETIQRQLGSIFWLLFSYTCNVPEFVMEMQVGYGDTLDWIRDFKNDYPDYSFTTVLLLMEAAKCQAAKALGLEDLVTKAKDDSDRAVENERKFWKEHPAPEIPRSTQQAETGSDLKVVPTLTYAPLKKEFTGLKKVMYELIEFHDPALRDEGFPVVFSDVLLYQPCWKILLRWMQQDYANSKLSKDALKGIFPLMDEEALDLNLDDFLNSLTWDTLHKTLLPPAGSLQYFQQWGSIFESLSSWLLSAESPPETRQFIIAHVQLCRLSFKSAAINRSEQMELIIEEGERFLKLISCLVTEVRNFYRLDKALTKQKIINARQLYRKWTSSDSDLKLISDCVQWSREVAQEFHELGNRAAEALELTNIARSRLKGGELGFFPMEKVMDEVMKDLARAESIFTDLRRESSVLCGVQSIQNQDIYAGNYGFVYKYAIQVLLTTEESEMRDAQMWEWIQKAKARSLAEYMGIGTLLSNCMIEKGAVSEDSIALLQEEKELLTRMQEKPPLERVVLRETHRQLLANMQDRNDLSNVLAIREGTPFSKEDLRHISGADKNVVFVDWFFPSLDANQLSSIVMMTVREGTPPRAWRIDLPNMDLNEWVSQGLSYSELNRDDFGEQFSSLDNLVAPLAIASDPGDTLVFCPTGILHRIPLHALTVNDIYLVRRNPIVYTYSLSILRYCFSSRHRAEFIRTPKPWKAAAFCRPTTSAGERAIPSLSRLLDTKTVTDHMITKKAFVDTLRDNISLLHFHGHCKSTGTDPLDQYLELIPDNPDEGLSTREIFALPTPGKSYHVNLLACHSGHVKNSGQDNALGLVTAFLHSGATSTVSTLWTVPDRAAAHFSTTFAKAMSEARKKGGGRRAVVDVAKATQEAVVAIMDSESESRDDSEWYPDRPLHWASFVMHGYWVLEV